MDHLARIAMKNAANCVKYGEMQGYRNRYMSNAYCGPVIHLTGPHLSEGLLNTTNISWLSHQSCGICPSIGIHPISSQFSRDESRALHGCFLLSTARLAPSSLNTDAALGDTTHLRGVCRLLRLCVWDRVCFSAHLSLMPSSRERGPSFRCAPAGAKTRIERSHAGSGRLNAWRRRLESSAMHALRIGWLRPSTPFSGPQIR